MSRSSSHRAVETSVYDFSISLESLVDKITDLKKDAGDDNSDDKKIELWHTKILDLAKEASLLQHYQDQTSLLMSEIDRKAVQGFQYETDADPTTRIKAINELFTQRVNQYDPLSGDAYKKVHLKLNPDDMGGEDVIVDGRNTEHDYKCPYTGTDFVEPMKK